MSKPMKKSSKSSKMSFFPPEIITRILIRLPIKSLLRFRCVSKPWLAEIDDPEFIKLHLTHSITTGSNHFPIKDIIGVINSLDSNSLEKLEILKAPFIDGHMPILLSICYGLLLLQPLTFSRFYPKKLFLFNPSTRKHHVLPLPPPNNDYADLIPHKESNYLGYDFINDDYKVFNIFAFVDQDKKFVTSEARIYSLKSDSWHIVKDFTKGVIFDYDFVFKAYVNGALHTANHKDCTTILALDVSKETFSLMPMPSIGDKNVSHLATHAFDGRLAVLCMYPDSRTDIWVMKEYGVKESWGLLLSLKLENSDLLVIPVIYSKSRTEILLNYGYQTAWYDLRKKTIRDFKVSGVSIGFSQVCVESLTAVGRAGKTEKKKRQKKMRNEGRDCQE